jgi:glycosyltransferase involved in cell wall biosynthesis
VRALDCLRGHFGRNDFRALVVGYGPAVDDLKRLTAELGLEQFVAFTGYLVGDDLLRHIASFDICVTPDPSNSYNDSCTTIKTMEYMALAKPIVAFDLPENRVSAGDAALYATANSEQDLARLLARLIDSPREREILGERGRQRVIESLTWEQQAHTLVKLYDNLLCPGVNAVPAGAATKGDSAAWPSLSGALEPSGDNEKVLA